MPLSIVVNGRVVSSPVVNSPICGGQGIIEGPEIAEAEALVADLLSGDLPIELELVAHHALQPPDDPAMGTPIA